VQYVLGDGSSVGDDSKAMLGDEKESTEEMSAAVRSGLTRVIFRHHTTRAANIASFGTRQFHGLRFDLSQLGIATPGKFGSVRIRYATGTG
jgi:hypothetical protein